MIFKHSAMFVIMMVVGLIDFAFDSSRFFFDRIQFGYTLDVCMCSVFGQLHARAISGNFLQI